MPTPPLPRAADGYFHPASETDVIALVKYAGAEGLKVRARGATHSVAWSIFTDPVDNLPPNQTLEAVPPASDDINIAFDIMFALDWIDAKQGIVEVDAGCHLGKDPSDPFNKSTLENSFLHQIFLQGWAVNNLGGITHQTVSGFTGTGSAGGSVIYAFDNVIAFRVVDGLGQAGWIATGDAAFPAMLTACGLLGIVTRLRFQLVPMYNIAGTEVTTSTLLNPPDGGGPACPVDLFGPGTGDAPSLQQFFTQTPYSRMTWWPQAGCERVQIWQAQRVPASNDGLVPYLQFTPDMAGQTKQLMASLFFVLLGNTSLGTILSLLRRNVDRYFANLFQLWAGKLSGPWRVLNTAGAVAVSGGVFLLGLILGALPGTMGKLFTTLLPMFNPMSGTAGATRFSDWYWRSLCMDDTADDVLLGTEFCEIWVPIQFTGQVMTLYQAMFQSGGAAATGYFAMEVYAAAPSPAWINPSYTDGTDLYKDGVSRFDVYWYRANAGTPNTAHGFFEQYWDLLLANQIPFRLHWGKFIPFYDFPKWAAYYRANLPRLDDFLTLRATRDPHNVFFTNYWQLRLLGQPLHGNAARSTDQGV